MVGILAILKAGGAYVAIDPDYQPSVSATYWRIREHSFCLPVVMIWIVQILTFVGQMLHLNDTEIYALRRHEP